MVELKIDPWRADHSAGAEAPWDGVDEGRVVDCDVESSDWSAGIVPAPRPHEPVAFVDGVMRTELRVLARDGDRRAWGMLGSCAAGGVLCNGAAAFVAEDEPVRRLLVVGSRVEPEAVAVRVGAAELTYVPHAVADDTPEGLRIGLQRAMLGCEQRVAERLAAGGVVFADGPLHLGSAQRAPVVGVVKRMVRAYLEPPRSDLLGRLGAGERTPLFALGDSVVERYAWYLRLMGRHPTWHELSGLVRCEVRADVGLAAARLLADLSARRLPEFAGRVGIDPRAPQNLTPVGALEARLKHRLGSAALIARGITVRLTEVNAGA